jgi:hypothetical protein
MFISHAFEDLGNEKCALDQNMDMITAFAHRSSNCRFILLLQTHADPSDGGLHFASKKTTDIHEVSR